MNDTSEQTITFGSEEEVYNNLRSLYSESQFETFFRSVAKNLAGKTLIAEGVANSFIFSLIDANDIVAKGFEVAPSQFIHAVVGDDIAFIKQVVNIIMKFLSM